jgi:hypothetical protein
MHLINRYRPLSDMSATDYENGFLKYLNSKYEQPSQTQIQSVILPGLKESLKDTFDKATEYVEKFHLAYDETSVNWLDAKVGLYLLSWVQDGRELEYAAKLEMSPIPTEENSGWQAAKPGKRQEDPKRDHVYYKKIFEQFLNDFNLSKKISTISSDEGSAPWKACKELGKYLWERAGKGYDHHLDI